MVDIMRVGVKVNQMFIVCLIMMYLILNLLQECLPIRDIKSSEWERDPRSQYHCNT